MKGLRRRDFLKYAGAGLATIVIGCDGGGGGTTPPPDDNGGGDGGGGDDPTPEPVGNLNFTITDAVKEMITHEPDNPLAGPAECYFWVFQEDRFPADNPGPQIFSFEGDLIRLRVTNELDGPHAFIIPGAPGEDPMVDTGPIAPGETVEIDFEAGPAGTYLYHDNLNAPVNRVMGLHGAFVVMPNEPAAGHKLTPYANPTPAVQALYDDFGSAPWWPGLAWAEGDEDTDTAPARQYIWLCHEASPVLFDEVGLFARNNPGQDFPAGQFLEAFTNDPFIFTSNDPRVATGNAQFPAPTTEFNRKPHFFTINGQSGFLAHHNPAVVPMHRVGEPALVRILNAGLMTHSMHLHANHFYVTAVNNAPSDNPLWVDVFNVFPMDHVDYTIPFMRPPDIPNERGIGRADPGLPTQAGQRTWPPFIELNSHNPLVGEIVATNFAGTGVVDMAVLQSPLCYPMHDHSEPTQTAQGGNYNNGLIAGLYFFGDRNTPGALDFELDAEFQMMIDNGRRIGESGPPTGGWPEEDADPA
jgi:FtsP/CotA-like multicopper oxidase with cupredoxin domain